MTIDQLQHRFDKYLKPKMGKMPVASIAVPNLRSVLLKIQDAGTWETAHRVRALAERIFRFAIATGRADRNIAADLRGTLKAAQEPRISRQLQMQTQSDSYSER